MLLNNDNYYVKKSLQALDIQIELEVINIIPSVLDVNRKN